MSYHPNHPKYFLEKIDIALSSLTDYVQTGKISKSEIIRQNIEEYLQMPIGDLFSEKIIVHPYVIKMYLNSLFQNNLNRTELGKERLNLMGQIQRDVFGYDDDSIVWVRVRKFNPLRGLGYYYGAPFSIGGYYYGFWNDEPILITIMSQEWLNEEQLSETGWITRPEVKMLAALSFSIPSWHGPTCYFSLSETYNFPSDLVFINTQEFSPVAVERFQITINILSRLRSKYSTTSKLVFKDISPYRFRTKGLLIENAERDYLIVLK